MCGMEPFKGSTHSNFSPCLLKRSLDTIFFLNVVKFLEEFEKSWKSICIPKVCANARNMCSKENKIVWVDFKVWV
jgi:hypothetical protein